MANLFLILTKEVDLAMLDQKRKNDLPIFSEKYRLSLLIMPAAQSDRTSEHDHISREFQTSIEMKEVLFLRQHNEFGRWNFAQVCQCLSRTELRKQSWNQENINE